MIFCLLLDRLSVNYLRPGIVLGSSRVGGSVRQCGSVRRLPRHISHLVRSKFKGHRCYGCENCEAAEMFFAITSSHMAWFTSNKDQNVPRRSLYRQLHFGCWKFKDHGTGRENAKTVFLTVAPPEVARFTLGKDQNVPSPWVGIPIVPRTADFLSNCNHAVYTQHCKIGLLDGEMAHNYDE